MASSESYPVVEHAEIRVLAGREQEFEQAFVRGHAVIREAAGYRWARLLRQAEDASTYLLLVGWDTLEAHTVDFRESERFTQWRGIVGGRDHPAGRGRQCRDRVSGIQADDG